jgi:hypothetical protein
MAIHPASPHSITCHELVAAIILPLLSIHLHFLIGQ